MDSAFWHSRWKEGRIGFHEGQPNRYLQKHVGLLGTARRVLAPLCGKAEDLVFLAHAGHTVVGVELVEQAARDFFLEHDWKPTESTVGGLKCLRHGAITIIAADFFATHVGVLGPVDALYDRAALIALPPDLRPRYAQHVRSLLAPGSPGLVITIDYDQTRIDGPPFSVPLTELDQLWPGVSRRVLETQPMRDNSRFVEMGVSAAEHCSALQFGEASR